MRPTGTGPEPLIQINPSYRRTHHHRDAREAKTTDALVDEMLTGGILDEKGERRTGLEKAATKLPAGGGEAGKALVAQIAAMTAAVKAQDPDAGNSRDFQCEPRR